MGLVKAKIAGRAGTKVATSLGDLDAEDTASRRTSARRLSSVEGSERSLLARLQVETDRQVRETLILSLIAQGTDEAVLGLVAHLGGEDVELRNGVVEALESMPEALAPHLDRLLAHPDSDVRILVCNVLAGLKHERSCQWLCAVLETDQHPNVCAAAIEALMEAGTPGCVPALRTAMARFPSEPFLCFSADVAIARIARP
ncbi:hypothetical protein ASG43_09530 [Aureimonas sp. Leaf454]|uniref:HEAT repeat domain-containing protein n=1 Tax=Aureimonas sp. Leaf454 TaxID=1736381 RepID=UPI0006F59C8A|nr:HEAT repeat domain-containing protein [Aureimonas sp. Leaf454]KQT47360.1 hypothetical protein ASG43_09530 [Aureimonas sp. Leaf454]